MQCPEAKAVELKLEKNGYADVRVCATIERGALGSEVVSGRGNRHAGPCAFHHRPGETLPPATMTLPPLALPSALEATTPTCGERCRQYILVALSMQLS